MQKPSALIATLLMALPLLGGAALPGKGPVPPADPRPPTVEEQAQPTTPPASEVPVPEDKPAAPAPQSEQLQSTPPQPTESRPSANQTNDSAHPAKDADLGGTSALGEPDRSSIETEDPQAYATCIAELRSIGASFVEGDRIEDGKSCGIDKPVEVSALLPDVKLVPPATLRCQAALQAARMTRDLVIPAAKAAFPDRPPLSEVHQASGYVCRNRNSAETGKLSEHALGNAIDIAELRFGDDNMPVMIAKQDDGTAEAAFQRAFNAVACLYFTTVLSPGSDPTHQDHMHLDVIERKSGFRYCR